MTRLLACLGRPIVLLLEGGYNLLQTALATEQASWGRRRGEGGGREGTCNPRTALATRYKGSSRLGYAAPSLLVPLPPSHVLRLTRPSSPLFTLSACGF